MTTYADVISKKDEIISLVKRFGYSGDVKIIYDFPATKENESPKPLEEIQFELRFIVQKEPKKSVPSEHTTLLAAKLSDLLKCEVDVYAVEYMGESAQYNVNIKSAFITDEKKLREIIYRVNNEKIDSENRKKSIADAELNKIKFKNIICKNIEGEYYKSLQKGLLEEAEEYLKQHPQETQSASSEAYDQHGLLAEKKHRGEPLEGVEGKKARSPARLNAGQPPAPLNGHSTSPSKNKPFS